LDGLLFEIPVGSAVPQGSETPAGKYPGRRGQADASGRVSRIPSGAWSRAMGCCRMERGSFPHVKRPREPR